MTELSVWGDRPYWMFLSFEHVYLEDSWVLDIEESESQLAFRMDLVLTERHQKYAAPSAVEQYCYRRATIVFPDVTLCRWLERHTRPAVDATGERDYGNIDNLVLRNGTYSLEGSWGRVEVRSAPPRVEFAAP